MGKPTFQKVFVKDHGYEFSPKVICEFLNIPLCDFDDFDKDYEMDVVATSLLGIDSKWPRKKTLKVSELTLKYASLHKVAMTNWWPTSHYPTILEDFACFLFYIITWVKVNLGQILFEFISGHGNRRKQRQKLPFLFLINGVLATQKELILNFSTKEAFSHLQVSGES